MLILMEEFLLVGQCLNVLAHLLGRVGGSGSRQLTLIRQRCHLRCNRIDGVLVLFVFRESSKRVLLVW